MQRRSFLSAVGGTVGVASLAGCTSGSSADIEYVRTRDQEGEVDEDDLDVTGRLYEDHIDGGPGVAGGVINEGDGMAYSVVVGVTFTDAEGNELGDGSADVGNVPADEGTFYHVSYPDGVSYEDVDDFDLSWQVGR